MYERGRDRQILSVSAEGAAIDDVEIVRVCSTLRVAASPAPPMKIVGPLAVVATAESEVRGWPQPQRARDPDDLDVVDRGTLPAETLKDAADLRPRSYRTSHAPAHRPS